MSIFDSIVKQESTKSAFDDIVESAPAKSLFDDIVESAEEGASIFDELTTVEPAKVEASWDDRVARTMTLSEDLVSIRSSLQSK